MNLANFQSESRIINGPTAGHHTSDRMKEYKRAFRTNSTSSAVAEHAINTGHKIDWEPEVIDQDNHDIKRKVREAIKIRERHPALNRDRGYRLPSVYIPILPQPRDIRN